MRFHGFLKLFQMNLLHVAERQTKRTGIIAQKAHSHLDRNWIDLAEKCFYEICVFNLLVGSFLYPAIKRAGRYCAFPAEQCWKAPK